jgi:hypothetical protein
MCSLERKRGLLGVIKKRRPPDLAVMAAHACGNPVVSKLLTVNVAVASFAFSPYAFEIRVHQASAGARRLMAATAFHEFMRTGERESGLEVIEKR